MRDEERFERYDEMKIAISSLSDSIFRRYHRFVSRDDIQQEMWLAVAKDQDRMFEKLDVPPDDEAALKAAWSYIRKVMWRAGEKYCRKEKAIKTGYSPHDEAFYDRQRVGALIDMRWNGTSLTNQVDDRPKGKTKPGSGYMLETEFADIDRALASLDPDEVAILMEYFVDGKTEAEVGETFGWTRQKAGRRINNATKKVIRFLGGDSPWAS